MDLKRRVPASRWPVAGLVLLAISMTTSVPANPCDADDAGCDAMTAAPPRQSPARARIDDLAELQFNARTGRFVVSVTGARLDSDPDTVEVFVNDRLIAGESVSLSRNAIEVDYDFRPGLNEVLVTAPDTEGREVRADGLYWAGDTSLVVDVTDAAMNPLDGVHVTVRLAQAGTVKTTATTQGGTARFDHLPDAALVVEAKHYGYSRVRTTAAGGSGPLLFVLSPDAPVASSGQ